eukprot:CAMPEP_0113940740 /NCGR_PEP_ID=MMETSP1339-20121228/6818_1 /TAXON_ID=94617 /ORGANISM="Fibrocapsa japonica" /LENGTH=608 /DNA_ID=CAMNT_0000944681 /DNA_START=8 /DNA_END=1830 /DNA_ORIENTATION=- /assembly_acc=CAM_ASM_000762
MAIPNVAVNICLASFCLLDILASVLLVYDVYGFENVFEQDLNPYQWKSSLSDFFVLSALRILWIFLAISFSSCGEYPVGKITGVAPAAVSIIVTAVKAALLKSSIWDDHHQVVGLVVCGLGCVVVQSWCLMQPRIPEEEGGSSNDGPKAGGTGTDLDQPLLQNIQGESGGADDQSAAYEKLLDEKFPAGQQQGQKPTFKSGIRRVLVQAKPEAGILAVGIVFLIVASLSQMAIPYFIGQLIDEASSTGDKRALDRNCYFLMGVFVVGCLAVFVRAFCFQISGERLVARLRRQLYSAVLSQETAFFDGEKTGELMSRLASDTTQLQSAATTNISMSLSSFARVLLSLLLMYVTSWRLSLVLCAAVPLLVVFARIYGAFTREISTQYQDQLAEAADVAQESLSNMRTIKSFAAEGHENERYGGAIKKSFEIGLKRVQASALFMSSVTFLAYAAMLAVLWYGGRLVIADQISAGSLTSFLLYATYIATGLGTLSGMFTTIMQAVGASERVFSLIDRKPAMPISGGLRPSEMEGHIVFEQVKFWYPARPLQLVLKNFSLDIQPNQTCAFVGPSGGGKSTVLALLQRFYDVSPCPPPPPPPEGGRASGRGGRG